MTDPNRIPLTGIALIWIGGHTVLLHIQGKKGIDLCRSVEVRVFYD